MRNLKRALSLLLSSAMVVGMMVMGGSAAGYQDVDASNQNQEAIEVLQAVGIMTGIDDAGNFAPDQSVTRNQMAVIMAHLLNLDYDYYRGTNTFTDVPEWAAPYVAACVAEGVTAGIGNNLYGGENKITAAQGSLMIMKALGYFQNAEDFGTDWQVATIRQASYINLFDKINSDAESPLTRGQVAQLVLNGLKSNMVDFTGDKGIQIGDVTVGYRAEYTAKTNAAPKYNTIVTGTTTIIGDNGQYYVQLGEELYDGDLRLSQSTDEFGRPTNHWEYLNDEVGNYVRNELLIKEYTSEVTGRDLYDLLNRYIVANDTLTVYIDGVNDSTRNSAIFTSKNLIKSNTKAVGDTGNGVLTQVYRDASAGEITVAIINTYLAKATDDFDVDNDVLDVDVYGYNYNNTSSSPNIKQDNKVSTMKADNEDVAVADYVEDDIMLVRIADGQIAEVIDPEILSDSTLTAFSLTKNTITSDGTTYDQADTRLYDIGVLDQYSSPENLKDLTYNIILDPYGYFIGLELNEDPDQYVFITGYEPYTKNLTSAVADAGAIFLDGTMDTIDVKVNDDLTTIDGWDPAGDPVLNSWYTYSVNDAGVYTLKPIADADNSNPTTSNKLAQFDWNYTDANKDIDKAHVSLPAWAKNAGVTEGPDSASYIGGMAYGNADSVYLTVSTEYLTTTSKTNATIIDGVDSVTTGVQNANISVTAVAPTLNRNDTSGGVYTLYNDKGYVIAAVVVGEDAAASTNYVFVSSAEANLESLETQSRAASEGTTHRWTREVIVNGELKELVYTGDTIDLIGSADMKQGNIYKVSYNANGEVTKTELVVNDNLPVAGITTSAQVATDIAALEGANGDDIVLLALDRATGNNKLTLEGWTLYTELVHTRGFSIASDAKAVLVETVDNKAYDEVTYFDSKEDNVKAAIDALYNDNNGTDHNAPFNGMVYAIMNDGVATSVIIVDDRSRPGVDDGNQGGNQGGGQYDPNVINNGGGNFTVNYYDGDKSMTDAQVHDAMIQTMERYTGMKVKSYSYPVGYTMVFDDGTTFGASATVTPSRQIAIYMDGVLDGYVNATASSYDIDNLTNGASYLINKTYANAADGTVSGNKITLNPSSYGTDVNVYTAYNVQATNNSDGSARTTISYVDVNGDIQSYNQATTMYFAKGTELTVTGQVATLDWQTGDDQHGTFRYFEDNTTKEKLNDFQLVVDTDKAFTPGGASKTTRNGAVSMTYTVSKDIQISESTDYVQVIIDGKDYGYKALYQGNLVAFTAPATARFARQVKLADGTAALLGQKTSGSGSGRIDNLGNGAFTYALNSADHADGNGVIELVQAAEVTAPVGGTITVSHNGVALTANKVVAVGDTLTVTGATQVTVNSGAPAAFSGTTYEIQPGTNSVSFS